MRYDFVFAGFGGQGIMVMGKAVAEAALREGRNVTWWPSYGAEMRGGTANCIVIVDDEPIASPILRTHSVAVVMNKPSLAKFEPRVAKAGKLFVNSSLIDVEPKRTDIEVYKVPATEIANRLGNVRVANMVMLGALLAVVPAVKVETVKEILKEVISARHHHLLPLNYRAMEEGAKVVRRV